MPEQEFSAVPGLGRRLVAILYDSLLIIALAMFTTAAHLTVINMLGTDVDAGSQSPGQRLMLQLLLFFGTFLFFCLFWRLRGQTLGMQAWRIQLTSLSGGRPSVWQCFIRYIGAILSIACAGLGYLWIIVDRRGYAWHDKMSGTRLVLLEKSPNKSRK